MKPLARFAVLLAALAVLQGGTGCQRFARQDKKPTEVRVTPVTVSTLDEFVPFVGTMRAKRRASVASAQGGRVVRVDVTDGDTVTSGQALVWLDTRDLEARIGEQEAALASARAHESEVSATLRQSEAKLGNDVEQAQQALTQAEIYIKTVTTQLDANKRDMLRLQKLFKEKAVSRSQMEGAELKYKLSLNDLQSARSKRAAAEASLRLAHKDARDVETARAQLAGAHAQVAQAEASVNTARVALSQTVLTAPMSGTVVERSVEPGQAVGGGATPLLSVVDNHQLECVTPIDERFGARVRRGMSAVVTTPISGDRPLKAEVVDVIPASDPKTNTLRMRLRIENPDNLLMDGLSINGRLTLTTHRGTVVPRDAVRQLGQETVVMVVSGQMANRRRVGVEFRDETQVLVTGVREGEFVVTEGSNLVDGESVTIDYTPVAQPSSLPEARPKAK